MICHYYQNVYKYLNLIKILFYMFQLKNKFIYLCKNSYNSGERESVL